MILRRSFLKLLALPVVAPLVALSTKITGYWRQDFLHDVWISPDGSETTLEEMEKWGDGRSYRMWIDAEGNVKVTWAGRTDTVLHDLPRERGLVHVSLDSVDDPIATWTPIK